MNLGEKFDHLSVDQIRELMHSGQLKPVELAVARGVLKRKELELSESHPTVKELEDQITQILEMGTKEQQRLLCTLVGEEQDYFKLDQEVKLKIMGISIGRDKPSVKPTETTKTSEKKPKERVQSDRSGKSTTMRHLFDEGKSIAEIASSLGCHYSFVHGVIARYKKSK